jgi:ferritin
MSESAQTPMKGAVKSAIEDQIGREFYAGYLYLSMAGSFEMANLTGFGRWMREQAGEERDHALKLFDFLLSRGERVELQPIDAPPSSFRSALDTFEQALEHEKEVTDHINDLYELAVKEHDHPARLLLNWFIEEQVEEEKSASEIVDRLTMAGDDTAAVLILDREMGKR